MQIAKALLAKSWKNEAADLEPGTHYIDEVLTVRIHGTVEKLDDEYAVPTVSIPLIPALAYFVDKLGLDRNAAVATLREALHEATIARKMPSSSHVWTTWRKRLR